MYATSSPSLQGEGRIAIHPGSAGLLAGMLAFRHASANHSALQRTSAFVHARRRSWPTQRERIIEEAVKLSMRGAITGTHARRHRCRTRPLPSRSSTRISAARWNCWRRSANRPSKCRWRPWRTLRRSPAARPNGCIVQLVTSPMWCCRARPTSRSTFARKEPDARSVDRDQTQLRKEIRSRALCRQCWPKASPQANPDCRRQLGTGPPAARDRRHDPVGATCDRPAVG